MNSNRNALPFSDERRRDILLRSAYMKIVQALDCRPEPRSTWDETNTGDVTPWRTLLFLPVIRKAILAAVATGDRTKIDHTVEAACVFCDELKADFRSLAPAATAESIVAVALDETHLEGEANEVQAQLIASPSPTNADRAVPALERQRMRLGQLIDCCRRAARETSPSLARSVR